MSSDARDDLPLGFHREELDRKMNNMLGVYRVVEIDAKKGRVKVELSAAKGAATGMDSGGSGEGGGGASARAAEGGEGSGSGGSKAKAPSGWLPMAMLRAGKNKAWSIVEPGEQVMIFAPGGDFAHAVVWGSIPSDDHKQAGDDAKDHKFVFEDGSVIEYDKKSHKYNMSMNKDATVVTTIDKNVTTHTKDKIEYKTEKATTTWTKDQIEHKTDKTTITQKADKIEHKVGDEALHTHTADGFNWKKGSSSIDMTGTGIKLTGDVIDQN